MFRYPLSHLVTPPFHHPFFHGVPSHPCGYAAGCQGGRQTPTPSLLFIPLSSADTCYYYRPTPLPSLSLLSSNSLTLIPKMCHFLLFFSLAAGCRFEGRGCIVEAQMVQTSLEKIQPRSTSRRTHAPGFFLARICCCCCRRRQKNNQNLLVILYNLRSPSGLYTVHCINLQFHDKWTNRKDPK